MSYPCWNICYGVLFFQTSMYLRRQINEFKNLCSKVSDISLPLGISHLPIIISTKRDCSRATSQSRLVNVTGTPGITCLSSKRTSKKLKLVFWSKIKYLKFQQLIAVEILYLFIMFIKSNFSGKNTVTMHAKTCFGFSLISGVIATFCVYVGGDNTLFIADW